MRRTAAAIAVMALTAGCAGSSAAAHKVTTDHATVNAVIRQAADGAHVLTHLSGPLESILSQYQFAESDYRLAAEQLSPAPSGVPAALARRTAVAFQAVADTLAAARSCFVQAASLMDPNGCNSGLRQQLGSRASQAGAVTSGLLPYSTLDSADVLRIVG